MRTSHSACGKFPDVVVSIVPLPMKFPSDENELAAGDVLEGEAIRVSSATGDRRPVRGTVSQVL